MTTGSYYTIFNQTMLNTACLNSAKLMCNHTIGRRVVWSTLDELRMKNGHESLINSLRLVLMHTNILISVVCETLQRYSTITGESLEYFWMNYQ